jgi:exodeoxyribonuclease X
MNAVILDTETTGTEDPEVIETAWLSIDIAGKNSEPGGEVSRWRPSKPISLGALATHHILDEDLVGCRPSSDFRLPVGVDYLIGHNIDFDWRAIGEPPVKRIDVCAMCRALWPEADSHSQSAMLYMLERQSARERLRNAHSAGHDVKNCQAVLQHVLVKAGPFATFEDLWEASERMRIPKIISFGKYKGTAIANLPRDYRQWMLKQADMDPYVLKAVRASLYSHAHN